MSRRCSLCGKKADISIDVDNYGFENRISYCNDCMKKVMANLVPQKRSTRVNVWTTCNMIPSFRRNFFLIPLDLTRLVDESISNTFGTGINKSAKIRYKVDYLKRKMDRAVHEENYELAGIIKREIERLESGSKHSL